eukprot:Colp12_sorted_trinity150504_noHs@3633
MAFRLSATLAGHDGDVRAVAALPGNRIVTGSRDKTAKVWVLADERNYVEEHILTGHTNYIICVAYVPPSELFPDGAIATGGLDRTINVYNHHTSNEPLMTLTGHNDAVSSLAAISGTVIVSGSWDKTARVWANGQCVQTLEGHSLAVWSVLVLPDGDVLTGSADKTIKRWHDGKCVRTLTGHTGYVRGLALIPDLGFVSCDSDSTVKLWALSGEPLMELHSTQWAPPFLLTGPLAPASSVGSPVTW